MSRVNVGIEALGTYIPQERHTAKYISEESGIPEKVLIEKFGLKSKSIPGPHDHTVQMGVNAASKAIVKAAINPETDIDLIIWAGEVHAEHPMQTYAIKVQKELNIKNAWAFDINQRCGTFIVGMMIAKSLMTTSNYKRALIVSGYRNSDLIDYKNPRSRFMYALAASGSAILMRADYDKNLIFEAEIITDGRFADDVYVPAGGTVIPTTEDTLKKGLQFLDVSDPEGLKKRLDEASMKNFLRVVDNSLQKSGFSRSDLDYLALLHMKRSAFEFVAKELGVDPYKQATYFDDLGHMGQNDSIISLQMGLESGKIKKGDIVVLTAAGIGWAWNAITIKWG
ncbi:MAG: 3-oxoacyl-[acyl-carrier-protein] synthase 3 [Candidatus Heimdallarchaeota archaeon LC_3]|nr:MAG: 3-oxoacyl-[acyl-carrier-protein] synthase 3 [Candidatus Heimdallarchaeota archaeon LC_3]